MDTTGALLWKEPIAAEADERAEKQRGPPTPLRIVGFVVYSAGDRRF
jgi:hypothetical protein